MDFLSGELREWEGLGTWIVRDSEHDRLPAGSTITLGLGDLHLLLVADAHFDPAHPDPASIVDAPFRDVAAVAADDDFLRISQDGALVATLDREAGPSARRVVEEIVVAQRHLPSH